MSEPFARTRPPFTRHAQVRHCSLGSTSFLFFLFPSVAVGYDLRGTPGRAKRELPDALLHIPVGTLDRGELEEEDHVREDGGAGHDGRDDGRGDGLHRSCLTVQVNDDDCAD